MKIVVKNNSPLIDYLIENTDYTKTKIKSLFKYKNILINNKLPLKMDVLLKKGQVIEISKELKNSDNEYYSYFSHYSEAFSVKQLADRNDGFTKEEADRIYEEKIAFFRSKMINKEGSAFAVIFRARMYAETGKFAKAQEMASLMSEEDKASVDQYIEMCKEELSAK